MCFDVGESAEIPFMRNAAIGESTGFVRLQANGTMFLEETKGEPEAPLVRILRRPKGLLYKKA